MKSAIVPQAPSGIYSQVTFDPWRKMRHALTRAY